MPVANFRSCFATGLSNRHFDCRFMRRLAAEVALQVNPSIKIKALVNYPVLSEA